jgi:large subunit ribosomal protein L18
MDKNKHKAARRLKRHKRIRAGITGTPDRPRLAYKSLNHFYAQVIDDLAGKTLAAASTEDKGAAGKTGNAPAAAAVGPGRRGQEPRASRVVFDRGGFKTTGG